MELAGKKVLLGVTAGIAAYKSLALLRLLTGAGAQVKVILTPAAKAFIGPASFAALSGGPVLSDLYDADSGAWHEHVALGLWADALVVAPCTANTLSAFAQGRCENLLQAVFLSARCPVWVAPAMDHDMHRHPSVQYNLELLKQRGTRIIPSEHGSLASGLVGEGRLPEPEALYSVLAEALRTEGRLRGKSVLITAGPTHEYLDPVRYLGNASSGRMGYALAEAFARQGAEVWLVSGPVDLPAPGHGVHLIPVVSAVHMHEAVMPLASTAHLIVCAAAVADYRPEVQQEQKIKKSDGPAPELRLVTNPDILAWCGAHKQPGQLVVGFALETDAAAAEGNAEAKLAKKNCDALVLNRQGEPGAGIGLSTNRVSVVWKHNNWRHFPLLSKADVAQTLLEFLHAELSF
jgi:phosphopantothenoylcysteine decarboxylase/phosphopantothenate--cysteine ligase